MTTYPKHSRSALDYMVDWGGRMNGRTIAASDWCIHPVEDGGLAVRVDAIGPTETRARLTGGIAGHDYSVSGRTTFADGGIARRTLAVRVTA